MTTDFRALCAELYAAVQLYTGQNPASAETPSNQLVRQLMDAMAATAAALAQPEPQGVTDEELLEVAAKALGYKSIPSDETCLTAEAGELLAYARAVLARYARYAIEPVPVAERLPVPSDCIRRADDDWCWGQERSLLTGQSAARWRLMRVSSLTEEAVTWLPHHALPVPQQEVK
jgi:hypothetical protein